MRRTTLTAALAWLIAGAVALVCAPLLAAGTPVVYCAEPLHDFGEVRQGEAVEHAFAIENRGTAPLTLLSLVSTCSCTTAPLEQTVIPPGGRAPARVRFDSTGAAGYVRKTLILVSDDPNTPQLALEIAGTVRRLYEAEPERIEFGRIAVGGDVAGRVVVRGRHGLAPPITTARIEGDDAFTARAAPGPGDSAATVALALKREALPHRAEGVLVIGLDDPAVPELRIPFSGQILPAVSSFPARIDFGRARPGETLAARVRLLLNAPGIRIRSVQVVPARLSARLVARRPLPGADVAAASAFEVELRVRPAARPGSFSGRIEIRTSSRAQPLIVVPLHGGIVGP